MAKELTRGCVVKMKASSGLVGYGNEQCVSSVCEPLGTLSLFGHNEHYKLYDVAEIVEHPATAEIRLATEREMKIINILNLRDHTEGCGGVGPESKVDAIRLVLANASASDSPTPSYREAGDPLKTGRWWYECLECRDELFQLGGDGGLHLECGKCGHEWYEGEYIEPTAAADSQELLPCPFCGGGAEDFQFGGINAWTWGVCCTECGASVEDSEISLACEKWNTRVARRPR